MLSGDLLGRPITSILSPCRGQGGLFEGIFSIKTGSKNNKEMREKRSSLWGMRNMRESQKKSKERELTRLRINRERGKGLPTLPGSLSFDRFR